MCFSAFSSPKTRFSRAHHSQLLLQIFIGGGFFKVINFGGGEESESANTEAVVGDFADACSLEGLDGQSDAS